MGMENKNTRSLESLQAELRSVDLNGWLTLEDDEQNDRSVIIAALEYIYANA